MSQSSTNYIRVIARCKASVQFLLPVLLLKDANKKRNLTVIFLLELDVYINRKSSFISTDLFIKRFTEHLLKHKTSGKVILHLDGHRAHCSSPQCLRVLLKYRYYHSSTGHCTLNLQPLDKFLQGWGCFLRAILKTKRQLVTSFDIDITWLTLLGISGVKLLQWMLVYVLWI